MIVVHLVQQIEIHLVHQVFNFPQLRIVLTFLSHLQQLMLYAAPQNLAKLTF